MRHPAARVRRVATVAAVRGLACRLAIAATLALAVASCGAGAPSIDVGPSGVPAAPSVVSVPSVPLPDDTPPVPPPSPGTLPPGVEPVPGEPADRDGYLAASRTWYEEHGVTLDDDALASDAAARCAVVRSAADGPGAVPLDAALAALDEAMPGLLQEDREALLAIAIAHWCPTLAVEPPPSGGAP